MNDVPETDFGNMSPRKERGMSEGKKVWYCVADSDPENGHEFTVNDRPPYDWGYIAQECAEHYFHHCDGWEDRWPQMVYLRETEDGPIVATFEVHMEAEPQFYAYEPRPVPHD